ncbi:MAG: FAD-dependent oxidoreductase [Planctomycetales bacterium]|nr:FAD-dependent oxidoreductase [Planctomycetales bacterium]
MHRLTRRELLAAFLGAPAALAGCSMIDEDTPPLPPGEIVGASHNLGHRVRDGGLPAPADDAWTSIPVVIVGGGVAGLLAGWRLDRAGFRDFVLLEIETEPGGTSRSGRNALTPFPWGAHYLPVPFRENESLISLLDEMGIIEGTSADGEPIVGEQFLVRDPEERVFYRGRWYEGLYLHAGESADDRAQLAAFQREVDHWVTWRDGQARRAFTIPVANCSDDADVTALDRLSFADWCDEHEFTSPRLRWLLDYACRDDYGAMLADVSAWAGLFYFASRIRRPGDEPQSLITWPAGNGRLVSHLHGKIRDRVRTGVAVFDIVPTDHDRKPGVDVVAWNHEQSRAVGWHADRVIFAAPQFLARYVIRPYRESPTELAAHLNEFQHGSWMVANLHLSARPHGLGFPLAWDNVIYDSPSLGYVVATHQRGPEMGPTVLTYYYPLCDHDPRVARSRLLELGRDEWAEVALADLSRVHPDIRQHVERLDVMRWGHAMVRPRPGFVWSPARRQAAQPFRNIHFANADLSGVPVFEEAFHHGVRAAEELLRLG